MKDEESFRNVIDNYSRTYWRDEPAAAIRIAKRLWNEHKLLQPRLIGGEPPTNRNAIWLEAQS
jgi:hypothetical protein